MRWIGVLSFTVAAGLTGAAAAQTTGGAAAQATATTRVVAGGALSMDRASRAAEALTRGAPNQALEYADEAIKADRRNGWAHYDRAAALMELRRYDEAVGSYRDAEAQFTGTDAWAHSVAVWGRAHALAQAGRCGEAREVYKAYARLVERTDPDGAAMAQRRADACRTADPAATP